MDDVAEVIRSREIQVGLIEDCWQRSQRMMVSYRWTEPGLSRSGAPVRPHREDDEDENDAKDAGNIRGNAAEPSAIQPEKVQNNRRQARKPEWLREVDDPGQPAGDQRWDGLRLLACDQIDRRAGCRKCRDV